MLMYNATLEDYRIQCNSIVFNFKKRALIQVPDDLVPFIEQQLSGCGVFKVTHNMSEQEMKAEIRKALIGYLKGRLYSRRRYYMWAEDDYKRRGITTYKNDEFERIKKWDTELRYLLSIEDSIDEEFSYLDESERSKLGIQNPHAQVIEHNIFSPEAMAQVKVTNFVPEESMIEQEARLDAIMEDMGKDESGEQIAMVKRGPGRPRKEIVE